MIKLDVSRKNLKIKEALDQMNTMMNVFQQQETIWKHGDGDGDSDGDGDDVSPKVSPTTQKISTCSFHSVSSSQLSPLQHKEECKILDRGPMSMVRRRCGESSDKASKRS